MAEHDTSPRIEAARRYTLGAVTPDGAYQLLEVSGWTIIRAYLLAFACGLADPVPLPMTEAYALELLEDPEVRPLFAAAAQLPRVL